MSDDEAHAILERRLGLHERLEVIYVADGYEATLSTHDGDEVVGSCHGSTITEALVGLAQFLKANP